jgi:hypothetical protein
VSEAPIVTCRYHPEQAALGICKRCRTPICRACCTRIRGINNCHACLAKLAQPAAVRAATRPINQSGAAVLILAGWAVLGLLFYWAQGTLAP